VKEGFIFALHLVKSISMVLVLSLQQVIQFLDFLVFLFSDLIGFLFQFIDFLLIVNLILFEFLLLKLSLLYFLLKVSFEFLNLTIIRWR
jgi:hypothetical protein